LAESPVIEPHLENSKSQHWGLQDLLGIMYSMPEKAHSHNTMQPSRPPELIRGLPSFYQLRERCLYSYIQFIFNFVYKLTYSYSDGFIGATQ